MFPFIGAGQGLNQLVLHVSYEHAAVYLVLVHVVLVGPVVCAESAHVEITNPKHCLSIRLWRREVRTNSWTSFFKLVPDFACFSSVSFFQWLCYPICVGLIIHTLRSGSHYPWFGYLYCLVLSIP